MSNHSDSTNHVTELFIEDLGRVTGGTLTAAGGEGGNRAPTTWSLVGNEEGGGSSAHPTTETFVGSEGSNAPQFPNFPNVPTSKMLGEGGGCRPPVTTEMVGESGGGPAGTPI
jgi:hypothetical protein